MTPRTAVIIALCFLTAVGFHLFIRERPSPVAPQVVSTAPPVIPASVEEKPIVQETTPLPKTPTRTVFKRDLVNPLVAPDMATEIPPPQKAADVDAEAARDFDKITLMLRDYRTISGENPTGNNAEIMKSIMGGNKRGAMLGPPEGQSLNNDGELIDRWGTPYFFHQLTKDLMEIRSAGPDRKMWSEDDLTGG